MAEGKEILKSYDVNLSTKDAIFVGYKFLCISQFQHNGNKNGFRIESMMESDGFKKQKLFREDMDRKILKFSYARAT